MMNSPPSSYIIEWQRRTSWDLSSLAFSLIWVYITMQVWAIKPTAALLVMLPGLGLLYFTLAKRFNRTTISIEHGRLNIATGPFWPMRQLDTRYIDQIWVEVALGSGAAVEVGTPCYALVALVCSGANEQRRRVVLLPEIARADAALWLEQQLESHLGIEDRPIADEIFVLPNDVTPTRD